MKTVKVKRVRPRSIVQDKKGAEGQFGIGEIKEISERLARDKALLEAEGYVIVTEDAPKQKAPVAPVVTNEGGTKVSAAALKLANEYGLDLSTIEGTGKGGTVTKKDVQALIDDGV